MNRTKRHEYLHSWAPVQPLRLQVSIKARILVCEIRGARLVCAHHGTHGLFYTAASAGDPDFSGHYDPLLRHHPVRARRAGRADDHPHARRCRRRGPLRTRAHGIGFRQ